MTYKKFTGYSPEIVTVVDVIVGIENRDGNTNVRFRQDDTLKRIFERLENARIHINHARMDCGSCSEAIVEMVEKHCRHFYIYANRCVSLYDDIFALRVNSVMRGCVHARRTLKGLVADLRINIK